MFHKVQRSVLVVSVLAGVSALGIAAPAAATEVDAPKQSRVIHGSMPAVCYSVPKTTTVSDGVPGPVFWKRLQCMGSMASHHPYTGPIDGDLGVNSWTGVQSRLDVGNYYQWNWITGKNDSISVKALQRWANANGHRLPVNGEWSGATYSAVADCLNRHW